MPTYGLIECGANNHILQGEPYFATFTILVYNVHGGEAVIRTRWYAEPIWPTTKTLSMKTSLVFAFNRIIYIICLLVYIFV